MTNVNPTNKFGQYIPAGSYQLSSREVKISINANSERGNGTVNDNAAVTYDAESAQQIGDIINNIGNLIVGGGDGSKPNPTNNFGQYVPAGSYQLSSDNIIVTIQAQCQKIDGSWVQSEPVRYSTSEAAKLNDISNQDGVLTLTGT